MNFSENLIRQVANDQYGLDVEVSRLKGYDEENFLLEDGVGKKYILKVATEQHNYGFIAAQVAILQHLSGTDMKDMFQQIIPDIQGEPISVVKHSGAVYYIRVLTYLDGIFWVDNKDRTDVLYTDLGSFLGKMDKGLQNFSHAAMHRHYTWDVATTTDAYKNVKYIGDHELRRMVGYFLLQFETEVTPFLSTLRQAYIHNDANDLNILVANGMIKGLIDFGDMVHSALVNNLAIACTYAMFDTADPLYVAGIIVEGYHREYPLTMQETDLLYYLVAARLCISLTQSAYNASLSSQNEHHFVSEKQAKDLLYKLIKINPIKAQDSFRLSCGFPPVIDQTDGYGSLLKERKKHIGRNLSISYQQPLKIVKGALQYLYDDRGNTFVDCVNNVSHVGHCHPVVVKAVQKQIATLNTNTRYLNDNIIAFAKALTNTLPSKLSVCYFTNSGSEANDLAIRMSRHFTKQQDVIVLDHAYHGTTTVALEMSPYKFDGKGGFTQKPYIHKAVSPDLYRGEFRYQHEDAGKQYANAVKTIIEQLSTDNKGVAAFICETLLGVGGQIPLPQNYLKEVYSHVRAAGGICIADEVQVGFGRVGEKFWGFELQDVEPDIVVLGKPIGNGHPLAAVIVTEEIADCFNNGMEYFNTYGGNPVSMTTGLSVLNVIKDEMLQQQAKETGEHLLHLLTLLMHKYAIIGDVRGHGLFVGAELVRNRETKEPAVTEINAIVERMKEKGFLLSTDGPLHNVLKIKPPLVFNKADATEMVTKLEEVLEEMNMHKL